MAIAEDYNSETLNIVLGNLEVRLAENNLEIDAAQALRYKVFFEEMQANPSIEQKKSNRDIDKFDHYFDHLLVLFAVPYRLLRLRKEFPNTNQDIPLMSYKAD